MYVKRNQIVSQPEASSFFPAPSGLSLSALPPTPTHHFPSELRVQCFLRIIFWEKKLLEKMMNLGS